MDRSASASSETALRSRRPQTRLETSCTRTGRPRRRLRHEGQAAGRRLRPYGPRERLRGVGRRHSTDETFEQGRKHVGGEGGGKAADRGEHHPASHVPDSERCTRVPGARRCAACLPVVPPLSEIRAVCANERTYGSVRGAAGDRCPYRDRHPRLTFSNVRRHPTGYIQAASRR
jgi:hypothetical protein